MAAGPFALLPLLARASLAIFLLWPCCAWSTQTVIGTVINGTTDKPSAGDDIALLTVTSGSLEVSRSKTASDGSFRLATDAIGPHILRVRHHGVIYQKKLTNELAANLQVFDSSTAVAGISESVTVMKIEPAARWLNVTELHSIVNESKPPRTLLASEGNLKIFLPTTASLDAVVVQEPSFRPDKVKPHPIGADSRQFLIGYPLRPGTTEFAVKYHLPYSEKATITPRLQYSSQLWTVMFPKSMNFTPLYKSSFHPFMEQDGMRVEAIAKVPARRSAGLCDLWQGACKSCAVILRRGSARSDSAVKLPRDESPGCTCSPANTGIKMESVLALHDYHRSRADRRVRLAQSNTAQLA